MVLYFLLKIINEVLSLSQSIDETVVNDELSDVLEFFSDLLASLDPPGFVF